MTDTPTLASAVIALAVRECNGIVRALSNSKDRHRGVHAARKGLRRLKSLLRLGTDAFGDTLAPVEQRIAHLATGLSHLRDVHVAVDMAGHVAGPHPADPWPAVIERLVHRRDGHLAAALQADPGFLKRRRDVRELSSAIQSLPCKGLKRKAIDAALQRSERGVRKAHKRAHKAPTLENLHRWRRRARRLRMQLQAWQQLLAMTGKTDKGRGKSHRQATRAMARLSDALGARQDLTALLTTLRGLHEPGLVEAVEEQIVRHIESHALD